MALYYLSGLAANLVTSASAILSSSEDANYPKENVGVGWPAKMWRASSAAADDWVGANFGATVQPTFFSVHGHNLDSGVTAVKIQKAANAAFTTSLSTVANLGAGDDVASPTFWYIDSSPSTARQYWRFLFEGTNGNPIEIGEMAIGVASTLSRAQLIEWSYTEMRPQSRQTGGAVPQIRAENLTNFPQRSLRLAFRRHDYTERNELRDSFVGASKNGAEPLIVIPDDGDELVVHGRVTNSLEWERLPGPSGGTHLTSLTIDEDPFWLTLT